MWANLAVEVFSYSVDSVGVTILRQTHAAVAVTKFNLKWVTGSLVMITTVLVGQISTADATVLLFICDSDF